MASSSNSGVENGGLGSLDEAIVEEMKEITLEFDNTELEIGNSTQC